MYLWQLDMTVHFCQSNFCILQEYMKKRLHYAMPRVPLHKLKMKLNGVSADLDVEKRPESYVGTMAKIIRYVKTGVQKAGDKQCEENDAAVCDVFEQEGGAACFVKPKISLDIVQNCKRNTHDKRRRSKPEHGKTHQKLTMLAHKIEDLTDFDLHPKDRKKLKNIVSTMQKIYKRTQKRKENTGNDSSDTTSPTMSSESSSQRDNSDSASDIQSDAGENIEARVEQSSG